MITEQHIKESLGKAYVNAIAAKAGLNFEISREHDYGVDGTFKQVKEYRQRITESGIALDYQLKSSKNWEIKHEKVVYDLEVNNHNDLVNRTFEENAVPMILILYCMNEEIDDCFEINESCLLLKKCCFWYKLNNALSNNSHKARIKIPIEQRLTPDSLTDLILKVQKGNL